MIACFQELQAGAEDGLLLSNLPENPQLSTRGLKKYVIFRNANYYGE